MSTANDVAKWMLQRLNVDKVLYKKHAVSEINELFGEEFAYYTDGDKPTISIEVIETFKEIAGDKVLWKLKEGCWRVVEPRSLVILWVIVIALLLWILTPIYVIKYYGNANSPGEFGDIYGTINALFSGFALAGAIYVILLQSKELRLQREELQLTRDEHAEHNRLVSTQVKNLIEQSERQRVREEFNTKPQMGFWKPTESEDLLYYSYNQNQHRAAYFFINLGGSIKIPLINNLAAIRSSNKNINIKFSPDQFFAHLHRGRLLVSTQDTLELPDEYHIEIDFEDSLEKKGKLTLYFGSNFQRYTVT